MTRSSQRDVLGALHRHGALTAKDVAKAASPDPRNAANICSAMACSGLLREAFVEGSRKRRRYAPAVEILPADERLLDDLVSAYGAHRARQTVLSAVARASMKEREETGLFDMVTGERLT